MTAFVHSLPVCECRFCAYVILFQHIFSKYSMNVQLPLRDNSAREVTMVRVKGSDITGSCSQ